MLRYRAFWGQQLLHPVARLLLLLVVGVLVCIAIGFIFDSGKFTRSDLLAVAFYLGMAAFAWRPTTAAFIVLLINSVGVIFTGSGGDLLELAIALSLVAATCAPWVIVVHVVLLGALTTYIVLSGPTLAEGGVYGIAGIAMIAFLAGVAFRLVAARETVLVAERARVKEDLEAIARENQERIADELHDGIAHDLTLMLFHARALPKQPDEDARQVSLATIEMTAERALQGIQSLLSLMRERSEDADPCPSRYDGQVVPAASTLGALLKDAGIPTRVSAPTDPLHLSPDAEQLLTETAIEAVTNIIKHAPNSRSASLDIRSRAGVVELIVANAWTPAASDRSAHSGGRGLNRARHRLAQRGGQLEAEATSDGWVLHGTIPIDADQVAGPPAS